MWSEVCGNHLGSVVFHSGMCGWWLESCSHCIAPSFCPSITGGEPITRGHSHGGWVVERMKLKKSTIGIPLLYFFFLPTNQIFKQENTRQVTLHVHRLCVNHRLLSDRKQHERETAMGEKLYEGFLYLDRRWGGTVTDSRCLQHLAFTAGIRVITDKMWRVRKRMRVTALKFLNVSASPYDNAIFQIKWDWQHCQTSLIWALENECGRHECSNSDVF